MGTGTKTLCKATAAHSAIALSLCFVPLRSGPLPVCVLFWIRVMDLNISSRQSKHHVMPGACMSKFGVLPFFIRRPALLAHTKCVSSGSGLFMMISNDLQWLLPPWHCKPNFSDSGMQQCGMGIASIRFSTSGFKCILPGGCSLAAVVVNLAGVVA